MIDYFDTSILVAYYCPEPLSEQAERLLRASIPPAISHLVQTEFASALSRKVRLGELLLVDGRRIHNLLHSHLNHGAYAVLPLHAHHFRQAESWLAGCDTPLRTLDALHLALAALEGARLITADQHMHAAAVTLGVDALLLTAGSSAGSPLLSSSTPQPASPDGGNEQ